MIICVKRTGVVSTIGYVNQSLNVCDVSMIPSSSFVIITVGQRMMMRMMMDNITNGRRIMGLPLKRREENDDNNNKYQSINMSTTHYEWS